MRLVLLACLWAPAVGAEAEVVTVALASKAVPFDANGFAAAKARSLALSQEYARLSKELSRQLGKKKERWPAEQRARLQKLVDDEFRTRFESDYLHGTGIDAAAVGTVAEVMAEELGSKSTLRLADAPEQADLTVEVLGCVAKGANAGLGVRLRPGGRLDPAVLAADAPAWTERNGRVKGGSWWSTQFKPFTAEEGFWLIGSTYPGISRDLARSCDHAGKAFIVALEAFVADHAGKLLAARSTTAAPADPAP